jgi:hypothetical protein
MRPETMTLAALFVAASAAVAFGNEAETGFVNDYPTAARADYVFGCMAVNGQTRDALDRCACSIDIIASLIPYDVYESGETVIMVARRGGDNTSIFRTAPEMQRKVDTIRRAQAEAELRCF